MHGIRSLRVLRGDPEVARRQGLRDRVGRVGLPVPTDTKELDAEGRESIEKLVEKLEEDDDVVNVYHNMKEADEE